jgi:TonB family protein
MSQALGPSYFVTLLWMTSVAAVAPSAPAAPPPAVPQLQRIEPFRSVVERLEGPSGAIVSSACGSGVAPWAYRGRTNGRKTTLRTYVRDEADGAWAESFVRTLLHESDWDSTFGCSASFKPCEQVHEVPLYAVELHAQEYVYVLMDFEKRCAQVFEPDRPLGIVRFADRADSLFDLIRGALHRDTLTRALSLPAARRDEDFSGRPFGYDAAQIERLPETVHKIPPNYPEEARRARVDGTVWIQALVGRDGAVGAQSVRGLDDAALDAVWRWKFKPAASGAKPIAVWVMIPVRFSLR